MSVFGAFYFLQKAEGEVVMTREGCSPEITAWSIRNGADVDFGEETVFAPI